MGCCSILITRSPLCLTNVSQIWVTCGFEADVLMGLAAVSRVSRDEVKEEEMMFALTAMGVYSTKKSLQSYFI